MELLETGGGVLLTPSSYLNPTLDYFSPEHASASNARSGEKASWCKAATRLGLGLVALTWPERQKSLQLFRTVWPKRFTHANAGSWSCGSILLA